MIMVNDDMFEPLNLKKTSVIRLTNQRYNILFGFRLRTRDHNAKLNTLKTCLQPRKLKSGIESD